ncbi:MAG: sulfatase-like hydrolase/transferase [Clostridia bacterium]|nr:sulfatase-like hydrolase/transferase [Clostridia bacterium]
MTPNILFICSDQQRRDCLGYVNDYPVKTPNIDALAEDGVDFSEAYTPNPICVPARRSMICGRRPEQVGTLYNYDQGIPSVPFSPDNYSWSRDLQKAGYKCGYIGAWHVSDLPATKFGYDDNITVRELQTPDDTRYENGWFGDKCALPLKSSETHKAAQAAIELIKRYGGHPFQIRVNFSAPHLPCRPCEPFASMYKDVPLWRSFDDDLKNKPFMQRQMVLNWNNANTDKGKFLHTIRMYYGYVSQTDDAIGVMINYLKQNGLYDNTVIIYTSDHGDMCGDRRMLDKHYIMYDSVVRVPLIIKYPGASGGTVDDMTVNALDIVPTVLDICGLEKPDGLQGVSLMPYLTGDKPEKIRKYALVTYNGQQFGLYTQRMITDGHIKYVWNCSDMDELYFLDSDPDELINRANDDDQKDLLLKLRRDMAAELKAADDYTMRSPWLYDTLYNGRKAKYEV